MARVMAVPFISVIVNDFHFGRPFSSPDKADTPLVIDANAVLTLAITLQGFEPVAGRYAQIPSRWAACSTRSFFKATELMFAQRRTRCRWNRSAVSAHLKD